MRVLCTCIPAYGHFHPMVPLARALANAGHEVTFATAERFHLRVAAAGLTAVPAGLAMAELLHEGQRRLGNLSALARDRRWMFGARMFAEVAAPAMVADLMPVVSTWRPDLVLHDQYEFGAPLAATAANIPYVNHSWGIYGPEVFRLASEAMAPLWETWGLPPPPLAGMFTHLYLDICPPSLQSPKINDQTRVLALRPVPFDNATKEDASTWIAPLAGVPTVYVTLGTVFNNAIGVFIMVIEAFRNEPLNVIITVGNNGDPSRLGPLPDHVHVERYLPQSLILPHSDLVVSHGGSGTMFAALAHGLPLLILPQGADNFRNARACVVDGVGRALLPPKVSADAIRDEVRILLNDPEHGVRARQLQQEIRLMPGPEQVVPLLERKAVS